MTDSVLFTYTTCNTEFATIAPSQTPKQLEQLVRRFLGLKNGPAAKLVANLPLAILNSHTEGRPAKLNL
jgi:hypothetical protein